MSIQTTVRLTGLTALLLGALGVLSACGAGCDDGHNHRHPLGSEWERGPRWEVTCRCTEEGVQCDDGSTAQTSGGMSRL